MGAPSLPTTKAVDDSGGLTSSWRNWLQRLSDAVDLASGSSSAFPVGFVQLYHGLTPPDDGWLFMIGQTISRDQYPKLVKHWQKVYGGTSDAIVLPNYAGVALVGAGENKALSPKTLFPLGDFAGEQQHVLTTPEMPSHNHSLAPAVHFTNVGTTGAPLVTGFVNASSGSAVGETTASTGGGGAHNNMQPSQAIQMMIRAR